MRFIRACLSSLAWGMSGSSVHPTFRKPLYSQHVYIGLKYFTIRSNILYWSLCPNMNNFFTPFYGISNFIYSLLKMIDSRASHTKFSGSVTCDDGSAWWSRTILWESIQLEKVVFQLNDPGTQDPSKGIVSK